MTQLFVIAGLNGSGKTTLTSRLFRKQGVAYAIPVVNPDAIEARSAPNNPRLAGKIALELRESHLKNHTSFAIETTLSGHSELRLMQAAKDAGYTVNLFFCYLTNPRLNRLRIDMRQYSGGHFIDEADLIRRARRIKQNLPYAMRIADRVWFVDNSGTCAQVVLRTRNGKLRKHQLSIPDWMEKMLASQSPSSEDGGL